MTACRSEERAREAIAHVTDFLRKVRNTMYVLHTACPDRVRSTYIACMPMCMCVLLRDTALLLLLCCDVHAEQARIGTPDMCRRKIIGTLQRKTAPSSRAPPTF